MIELALKGIGLGVTLSLLVGPILFTLVQAGLEKGIPGGLTVAAGVWTSDFLYIITILLAFQQLTKILKVDHFTLFAGIAGGVILLGFGIGMILSRKGVRMDPRWGSFRKRDMLGLWVKGFAINTLNPFTVFFWVGVMTTLLKRESGMFQSAIPFLAGLMGTVVIFDILKVISAEKVSKLLQPYYILRIRRICGILLIVFGLILISRVVFFS